MIVGYKRPDLARELSRRLDEERIAHPPATEFLERRRFLDRLAESRVAVCLPLAEEGFYDEQEVKGRAAAPAAGSSRHGPAMPDARGPKLDFMIVGAQKCGTTALAHFLSRHPGIGMADPKEVHLFDAPDYSGDWSPEEIDERYRPSFAHCPGAAIRGEATPIYMFLPEVARELERYNPELKLIVLLRDPVERAVSQYCMERDRGDEHLPLWRALSSEPFRLRRCRDARQADSAMRRHSYRWRGLYSLQLRNLYRFFRKDRVLVIRTRDLLQHHDAVLRQVFAFLGVSGDMRIAPGMIYPPVPRKGGSAGAGVHRTVSWLLKLSYLAESVRLRALLRHARIVDPAHPVP